MDKKIPTIVQKDDPTGKKVLRDISPEIPVDKIISEKIQKLISDMKSALQTQNDGVALAAPQIGVSSRIFIVNPAVFKSVETKEVPQTVFINPKITKISKDRKAMEEGCLSVRPWYGKVRRASRATVEAYNQDGEKFELEGTGLLAQIFQHEIDHLEGILFTDKAKDLKELPTEFFE
jgi:peptide deformylase